MILHYNIRVVGRVQKVGYRYTAYLNANKFGLTGFIKNETDQSVYIEAEGSETNLNEFVDWCKEGTESSVVDQVDVKRAPVENFREFTIRRT
jgi:acylphosphatase